MFDGVEEQDVVGPIAVFGHAGHQGVQVQVTPTRFGGPDEVTGITSGLDLALWLVTRELGAAAAVGVESVLEYEQRGVAPRMTLGRRIRELRVANPVVGILAGHRVSRPKTDTRLRLRWPRERPAGRYARRRRVRGVPPRRRSDADLGRPW